MADTYTPNILSGGLPFATTFNVDASTPFDSRLVVQTKQDLTSVFFIKSISKPSDGNKKPCYAGMIVTVADENKAYMLKSAGGKKDWGTNYPTAADPSVESNWLPIGSDTVIVTKSLKDEVATKENLGKIYFVTEGINDSQYAVGIYTVVEEIKDGEEKPQYKVLSFIPDIASNEELTTVKGRVDTIEKSVEKLADDIKANTNNIAGLNGTLTTLDNTIKGLVDDIEANTNNITSNTNSINTLNTNVNKNIEDISALNTAVSNFSNNYLEKTSVISTDYITSLFEKSTESTQ